MFRNGRGIELNGTNYQVVQDALARQVQGLHIQCCYSSGNEVGVIVIENKYYIICYHEKDYADCP